MNNGRVKQIAQRGRFDAGKILERIQKGDEQSHQ